MGAWDPASCQCPLGPCCFYQVPSAQKAHGAGPEFWRRPLGCPQAVSSCSCLRVCSVTCTVHMQAPQPHSCRAGSARGGPRQPPALDRRSGSRAPPAGRDAPLRCCWSEAGEARALGCLCSAALLGLSLGNPGQQRELRTSHPHLCGALHCPHAAPSPSVLQG